MAESLTLHEFLSAPGTILDVRSPGEYVQGRIPGAFSLPLFTNEERAIVGTTYKQVSKQAAIQQGLEIVRPKLANFTRFAQEHAINGHVRVHCWRGGMRSSSMAWLLRTVGLKAITLVGGYKTFRRFVINTVGQSYRLHVIGGLTGSGKTAILRALRDQGEQVLDLEGLANHRGSSYGMIGMSAQPSSEHLENEIAFQLNAFDSQKRIWIEDESRLIGTCRIPDGLFAQMMIAPLFLVERSLSERLEVLRRDYGHADKHELILASQRLAKRLGNVRTKEIVGHISEGRLDEAMEMVLEYYDSTYCHGLKQRSIIYRFGEEGLSDSDWAQQLVSYANCT